LKVWMEDEILIYSRVQLSDETKRNQIISNRMHSLYQIVAKRYGLTFMATDNEL